MQPWKQSFASLEAQRCPLLQRDMPCKRCREEEKLMSVVSVTTLNFIVFTSNINTTDYFVAFSIKAEKCPHDEIPALDVKNTSVSLEQHRNANMPSASSSFTNIPFSLNQHTFNTTTCQCESKDPKALDPVRRRFAIQRSRTLRVLSNTAKKHTLASLYTVDWDAPPIGSGAFGHVLLATHKQSGDRVALKRIPKKLASREDFQREMEALLRIQKWGGHPHICALREHFDEGGYYYLILDLIEGGESKLIAMFTVTYSVFSYLMNILC
jgi:hypothetical protein